MIFHFVKAPETFLDPDVVDYLNGLARKLVFDQADPDIADVFRLGAFMKASAVHNVPFLLIYDSVYTTFEDTISIIEAAKEKGVSRQAIYVAVDRGAFDVTATEPVQIIANAKYRTWTAQSGGKTGRSGRPRKMKKKNAVR